MNKNILYAFMAGATAFGLAGCNENSWNNHFLDGLKREWTILTALKARIH